ncbi:hypothetical protein GFGA_2d0044 (plasmid) [Gluconobacter frateurii NBRC 103465]|uniref:beta-lactamase hydrolase domain-containing protein n=1 Tax=Gluconobacter cerinus TaxID=38307 RepID=UPI0003D2BF05|nr:hypothetical protein GFGA_2d0044 [Gluconobacter frateurii NBRC 103465]
MHNSFEKLSPDTSVSSQITAADVGTVAGAGFKSILCLSPEGEKERCPNRLQIEQACFCSGLDFSDISIPTSGPIAAPKLEQIKSALSKLPSPVLIYSGSDLRAARIWTEVMAL